MIRLPIYVCETGRLKDLSPVFSEDAVLIKRFAKDKRAVFLTDGAETRYIAFTGALADSFATAAGFPAEAFLKRNDLREVEKFSELFSEIYSSYSPDDEYQSLRCWTLLYKLLLDLRSHFIPPYDDLAQHKRMILAPALELIHNESRLKDLSLQDIADAAGISVIHLSRLFKEITGDTPNHYMLIKRFDHARKTLLEDMARPISEIAKDSGFSSVNAFGAAFKREFGLAPGEYRAAYRGKPLPKSCSISLSGSRCI